MNIYIIKGKIYYKKNKKDEFKMIQSNDWASYLTNWNLFTEEWKPILDIEKFGIKNNSGDGDCLFLAISEGLNLFNKLNKIEYRYNASILRNLLADEINEDNFNEYINLYRIEFKNNDFIGEWNPNKVKTITRFKNIIKSSKFLGDYLTISLFEKILKINFIILDSENTNIYNLGNNIKDYNKIMILYYDNGCDFKLVGYFNDNKINTIFENKTIPENILNLYNNF
jgi:hypothetical protein